MISILMPVKNEAKFLQKTISSILSQSESNFELIAVDDHSSDNSFEILKEFSEKESRIKLFKNEGEGTISALQTAEKNASGEFITRMDADDLMPTFKLEELQRLLSNFTNNEIATGHVEYFSDENLADGFISYANWLNKLCEANSHWEHVFKECVIASPNWMMHRQDFDAIGGFSDLIYPEDYHFVFKLYEAGFKVISSDKVTHLWRDHPTRASRNLEYYQDQKFFDIKLMYFIRQFGKENIAIWGTGKSGKKLAKLCIDKELDFIWLSNNERKIGEEIYRKEIKHFEILKVQSQRRVIISVSQRDAMKDILHYLEKFNVKHFYEF